MALDIGESPIVTAHRAWEKEYRNSYYRRWAEADLFVALMFTAPVFLVGIVGILLIPDFTGTFLPHMSALWFLLGITWHTASSLHYQQSVYSPDHPNYNGG